MKRLSTFTCFGAIAIFLSGCTRAPEVDVLGSFFPAWVVCMVLSLPLTALLRWILIRLGLEDDIGPLVLFYGSVSVTGSAALWLVFYR